MVSAEWRSRRRDCEGPRRGRTSSVDASLADAAGRERRLDEAAVAQLDPVGRRAVARADYLGEVAVGEADRGVVVDRVAGREPGRDQPLVEGAASLGAVVRAVGTGQEPEPVVERRELI